MRRSRPLVVLAGLVVAGLTMLSWTQTWVTVHLDAASAIATKVTASGSDAASSLSALAIACLALCLALTIAGPVLRIVLASIEVLLGVAIAVSSLSALGDPVRAASSAVADVAGVNDIDAIRGVVTSYTVAPWPYLGVASGVLAALLGVVVLVVQRRWPGPSRKYGSDASRPGAAANRPVPPRDAVVDWDDLSSGVDPTSAAERTGVEETAAASAGTATSSVGRPGDTIGLEQRQQSDGAAPNTEEHRDQH